jgi:hypothetical protein
MKIIELFNKSSSVSPFYKASLNVSNESLYVYNKSFNDYNS